MADLTREDIERSIVIAETATSVVTTNFIAADRHGIIRICRQLLVAMERLDAAEHFVPGICYALENCRPDEIEAAKVFWGQPKDTAKGEA